MADYPNTITDPRVVANKPGTEYDAAKTTRLFAEDHNGLADEIVAIEEELGLNPRGSSANVAERIEDIESKISKRQIIALTITAIKNTLNAHEILAMWFMDEITGKIVYDKTSRGNDIEYTRDISNLNPLDEYIAPTIETEQTSDYFDAGDKDDFTFGNGSTDQPLTIITLCKHSDLISHIILAKADYSPPTPNREYRFGLNSSGKIFFNCIDNSSAGVIGRICNSYSPTTTQYSCIITTYDGSGSSTGIKIYVDGVELSDTDSNSGSYTAMENTNASLRSCITLGSGEIAQSYSGRTATIILTAGECTEEEVKTINQILLGYINRKI